MTMFAKPMSRSLKKNLNKIYYTRIFCLLFPNNISVLNEAVEGNLLLILHFKLTTNVKFPPKLKIVHFHHGLGNKSFTLCELCTSFPTKET